MTEILSPTDAEILNDALHEVQATLSGTCGLEDVNRAIELLKDVRSTLLAFGVGGKAPYDLRPGDIIQAPNGEHAFVTGHPWYSGIDRQTVVIPTDNDEYPIVTAYRYAGVATK